MVFIQIKGVILSTFVFIKCGDLVYVCMCHHLITRKQENESHQK